MKTYNAKPGEIEQQWHIIDASGKILGRLSTEIANILRGKHRPTFTPHVDTGDFVVVINAEKIEMTGNKWKTKNYYRHSEWFGGLKTMSAEQMRDHQPEFIIREAVKGMLPKNKLARNMITKLKVYAGPEHPHKAQKPEALTPSEPGLIGRIN
ncbi:MAG: 50S ribosomal protein L13 [Oligoflexia bacterium]|nr:50S ribosomal protein L13 [Oligoflexia bacterium]